ncbi:MAG TPA: glycosyltransferase family 39 protein [Candidatus Eisenbacteria bacterium]|nr:glycosyltransferase family 39 protein [Candidatus Eisenbacteria bacterium]
MLLSRWTAAAGVFLASFLLIAATVDDYGIAWDEPAYFHAADLHIAWIAAFARNVARGEPRLSLNDQAIRDAWRWNPYHVPHPPFSRIISGFTRTLTSRWLDKFTGYRLAPALFFAALVTVMFLWMAELFGKPTAWFSALSLIAVPNLFGFAHIAVTDLPLASLWFLTTFCFWKGLNDWRWSVACGILWGLALATKFPALLIPVPLLFWAHIFHRKSYANNVFALLFIAPSVMVATQPYLWHQTGLHLLEFLYEGLSRGYRPETNFPIYFFGQHLYTHQLPWYYPFFLVGVTTPEPLLLLALVAIGSLPWLQLQRATMTLFLINLLFVLLLGLLPGAVLHDGMRQLLAALPFIAALAGGGFCLITRRLWTFAAPSEKLRNVCNLRSKLIGTVGLLALFPALLELYLIHPFQLSFYNRLVGGIRGAYEKGLEATYFMEAMTPDFLTTLNTRLPLNARLNGFFANFMLRYYQQENRLRHDIEITDGSSFDYYLLLNRRSILLARNLSLPKKDLRPFLSVQIATVPLVSVFKFAPPS